jgi:hypothetical protein
MDQVGLIARRTDHPAWGSDGWTGDRAFGRATLAFLRINDAVPNSIVDELMERLNAKLEHDSRPIRFYGPGANPQRSRYFLVALA